MNNNTISAFHIWSNKNGVIKLNTNTLYNWHIPKNLRVEPIQSGDIVLVQTQKGLKHVLVMNVFREELEEANNRYERVFKIIERAPQKLEI